MNHWRSMLLGLLCAGFLVGQTERGIVTGTVTDASGAVVPAARVTVTNVATGASFSTETTATGNFTVPSLPPGTYTVRIEAQGFKAYEQRGVVVAAGGTVPITATLEVGAVTESISVTSTLAQIQTETAKVTTQVSTKMVDELPLVVGGAMRGAFDLAIIAPEASKPAIDSDKAFNVGGGQAGA